MAECGGVVFTVTADGNEVAVVGRDGAATHAVAVGESFLDADKRTRHHFVDVQGRGADDEASQFLVTVREDQRRVVAVRAYGGGGCECEGVVFTVTDRDEVAVVVADGAATRVLRSESFLDVDKCTRRHFVDVQGKAEAMLFLVSVHEDQRRVVFVQRC
ncbi:hypothetical protein BS78_08G122200 [Paspalum vaginatum]|nr:hypothetical protein BS78_08G122200 [Paspalum vaginatum]